MNGIDATAPDEVIKSVLVSARWHEDDVETALVILRENPANQTTRVDSMQRVLSSDKKISADTLNAILGINVEVDTISEEHHRSLEKAYQNQILSLTFVSIVLAVIFLFSAMYVLEIGVFYSDV